MSDHCHTPGCHSHGASSSHEKCGCRCHDHHGSCGCHCSSCCSQHHDVAHSVDFLQLADEAWYELLKERIKEYIEQSDPKIDELAQLISEANHNRWKEKLAIYQTKEDFEKRFKELFHRQRRKG